MNVESVKLFVLQNYSSMTMKSIFSRLFITASLMIVVLITAEYYVELLSLIWLIRLLYIGHTILGVYLLSEEKRRTIRAKYLFEGTLWSLLSVFSLFVALAMLSDASVSVLGHSILLLFLTVSVVMSLTGIIKMSNRKIAIIANENISNQGNLFLISGASFGLLGAGIGRILFSSVSPEADEVIGFVVTVIMILIFASLSVIFYHKYYLIRKYCPEIQEEIKQNSHRNNRQM